MANETNKVEKTPDTSIERALPWNEVRARTMVSRTTAWRGAREGTFPRPRQISPGRVGWLESEIVEWLRNRPVAAAYSEEG